MLHSGDSLLTTIYRQSSTDNHRGFGYVEFSLPEDAREAIDNMDQAELYGRVIKVTQAKPQKNADEKLGSRTAVWEQVRLTMLYTDDTSTNICPRKDTQPRTTLAATKRWTMQTTTTSPKTQCKDWKTWEKLVPGLCEGYLILHIFIAFVAMALKGYTHAFVQPGTVSIQMTIYSPSARSMAFRHLKACPYRLPCCPASESRLRAWTSSTS